MDKCLAIIPARKGSKRIKNKNLVDFFGKPLLQYTVDAAVESSIFFDVVISTDYEDLPNFIETYDKVEILIRNGNLSDDIASVMDVANHVLDVKGENYDFVFILLPSTPLRNAKNIRDSFRVLTSKKDFNAVISVSEYNYPLIYAFTHKRSGFGIERAFPADAKKKSQQQIDYFADNGGIYGLKPSAIRAHNYFPKVTAPYKMKRWASIDIDTPDDLEIAKAFYSHFFKHT